MDKPEWYAAALCSQTDPELFYGRGVTPIAKKLCASCPVLTECRQYALDAEEEHGVWGGMSKNDRKEELRRIHGPDYLWPSQRSAITGWGGRAKCFAGHDLTEDNVMVCNGGTGRRCRKCKAIADGRKEVATAA